MGDSGEERERVVDSGEERERVGDSGEERERVGESGDSISIYLHTITSSTIIILPRFA